MSSVFISYSRKDEAFSRQLAASLSEMGLDVWIDVDDIPVGQKWSSAIQQGLDKADLMILVISPDSMASQNVEDEWQYFLDSRKTVVPVLARPAKIHFQLNRVQYIDFHNQDYRQAFEQLVRKLREQGLSLPTEPGALPVLTIPHQPVRLTRRAMTIGLGALVVLVALGFMLIWQNANTSNQSLTQTAIISKDLTIESLVRTTATAAPLINAMLTETAAALISTVEPRVTAKDDTSVHSGDGSSFPTFARLEAGVSARGYYIELADGRRGWVCKNCVDLNVPLSSLTFIDDESVPTFTPTAGD